jgi:hypothetical protein
MVVSLVTLLGLCSATQRELSWLGRRLEAPRGSLMGQLMELRLVRQRARQWGLSAQSLDSQLVNE